MNNNNNSILLVTGVSETFQENGELSNDRKYKVITVKKMGQNGIISTAREHSRTIWSHQPMSGPESDNPRPNDYFDKIKKGSRITGRIETVETKPYFIESENGKFTHPETNNPANKVSHKTYVVFEDENVESLVRNDRNVELPDSEEQGFEDAPRELVAEDLGEESEEVPVS